MQSCYLVLNPYNALFQPKLFEEMIINNIEQTKIEYNRKLLSEKNGYFSEQCKWLH